MWAQLAAVSGRVVSAATGERISGATVTARSEGVTVITNDDGFFTLKTETMPRELMVSHLGYKTERVALPEGSTTPLTVTLKSTSIQLHELLVVSTNPRDSRSMKLFPR